MRLLYLIIDGLPTFRADIAVLWGKCLPREGISADIAAQPSGEQGNGDPWPSGRALLPRRRRFGVLGELLHDLKVLATIRRGDYAAIQLRDKSFVGLACLVAARWLGIPFYYWMSFPYGPWLVRLARSQVASGNRLRRAYLWWRGAVGDWVLFRIVLPRADHIFVQSDRMLDDLTACGLDPARMTPVPMGIDPDRFPAILQPAPLAGIPAGARVVGYLGECSRVRRPDFLIKAVAKARQSDPSIFLLIVGDALHAEDSAWLRAEIEAHGLADHAHVTGWVGPAEATATIAAAEICVALMAPDPILDSTSPTKLVEYLAMGRPVLANAHPDHSRVIAESGAGLIAPFDVDAFAAAMCTLLDQGALRAGMAEAGRAWALAERAYPNIAARLAAKYHALAAQGV